MTDFVFGYFLVGAYFLGNSNGIGYSKSAPKFKINVFRLLAFFAWPLVVLFGLYLALTGKI